MPPFVKLREASGRGYTMAAQFVDEVTDIVCRERAARDVRNLVPAIKNRTNTKLPCDFHNDPHYAADLHRADLAWAIYAASRGLSEQQIKDAILHARDLSKKGRP